MVPPAHRLRAIAALSKLRTDIAANVAPADPAEITRNVELMAQMFQVELPEDDGLMLYVATLSDVPAPLLKKGLVHACKNHKYKSLPLPAEIIEPIRDDMIIWRWFDKTLEAMLDRLKR